MLFGISSKYIKRPPPIKEIPSTFQKHSPCWNVTKEDVLKFIRKLKKGTSPGINGVNVLADTYSIMISLAIIPEIFQNSLIVPNIQKTTLDPNVPNNYRPIAISSIHTQLVEYSLMPEDTASENQFGFRKGCGTSCAILS